MIGTLIGTSRGWCEQHVGKIFTLEEIKKWETQTWSGKKGGSAFVSRGGWNCRHSWKPILDDKQEDKKPEPLPPEPAPKPKPAKKPAKKPVEKQGGQVPTHGKLYSSDIREFNPQAAAYEAAGTFNSPLILNSTALVLGCPAW